MSKKDLHVTGNGSSNKKEKPYRHTEPVGMLQMISLINNKKMK